MPDNAPVRLNAQGGLGSISVPSSFSQISDDSDGVSRSGEWETANYANADGSRIQIDFNGGVGQLVVQ
ncbi:MAG: hypothetical protein LC121_14020 [Anaerolineae bacterium]|nr:hypothetical protein [Anaerolineae bacterium]